MPGLRLVVVPGDSNFELFSRPMVCLVVVSALAYPRAKATSSLPGPTKCKKPKRLVLFAAAGAAT